MGQQLAIRLSWIFSLLSLLAALPVLMLALLVDVGYGSVQSVVMPLIGREGYEQFYQSLTRLQLPSLVVGGMLGSVGFVFALIALKTNPGGNRQVRPASIVVFVLSLMMTGFLAFIVLGGFLLGDLVLN